MSGGIFLHGAQSLLLAQPYTFYSSVSQCRLVLLTPDGEPISLPPFDQTKGNWYQLQGAYGFGFFAAFDTSEHIGAPMIRVDFFDANNNPIFYMSCGGKVVDSAITVMNCLIRFPFVA